MGVGKSAADNGVADQPQQDQDRQGGLAPGTKRGRVLYQQQQSQYRHRPHRHMNEIQHLEANQSALLTRLQIGGNLGWNGTLEVGFEYGELRFDAVAGLELQKLQHRVIGRRAQIHHRIAPQALHHDAAVFFLLRLAGEPAQSVKAAAGTPQPGIGRLGQPVLIGAEPPIVRSRRRTSFVHHPLDDAVLHQPREQKDRTGLADEEFARQHKIAGEDQSERHHQPDHSPLEIRPWKIRPPAARGQLQQRSTNQEPAQQTQ